MNTPSVSERLSPEVSYLEYGGIAYSGTATGTFSAVIASAPGNAPGFKGTIETIRDWLWQDNRNLNKKVGNVFANMNSHYPSVEMDLAGNYSNLDIAPQEGIEPKHSCSGYCKRKTHQWGIHSRFYVVAIYSTGLHSSSSANCV